MKTLLVVGLVVAGFLGMAESGPADAGRQIEYVEAWLQDEQCFGTGVPLKTTTRIVMDFQYSVNPGNTSQFSGASYFNPGFMWGVHEGYFAFHDPIDEYVKTSVPVDDSWHVTTSRADCRSWTAASANRVVCRPFAERRTTATSGRGSSVSDKLPLLLVSKPDIPSMSFYRRDGRIGIHGEDLV